MKTEKLSLKGIKNVLSRAEMKKIMAGSQGGGCPNCNVDSDCVVCIGVEFHCSGATLYHNGSCFRF